MKDISEQIRLILEQGEPLMLATIVQHQGSTPRRSGAKMIVRKDGSIHGTIGGGAVEAGVIRMAPDVFASGGAILRHFNFNSPDQAGSLGMICGGELDILLERLTPEETTKKIFSELAFRTRSGKKSLLGRMFHPEKEHPPQHGVFLVTEEGDVFGNAPLDPAELETMKEAALKHRAPMLKKSANHTIAVDPFFFEECVYLFGAGHVSRQVAMLLNISDFRTVVIDDRKEFADKALFPTVDDIIVQKNFHMAFSDLSIDRNGIIVILTRGHTHDQTVLEQALKTDAAYIGMIGSKRKRDTIYDNLATKGVSRQELARVHSPIGIDIGAQTPEEIAVSIVAELIAHRAGMKV